MLQATAVKSAFVPIICSSAAGILVSTFVYRNQFLNDESLFSYVIVKHSSENVNLSYLNSNCTFVFTDNNNENDLDKTCNFFQIEDFKKDQDINLNSIISTTKSASQLVKDKYYKIKIKKDTLKQVNLDGESAVSLATNGSSSTTVSFSPLFLIEDGKAVGKFEYFEVENIVSSLPVNCFINSKSEETFSNQPPTTNKILKLTSPKWSTLKTDAVLPSEPLKCGKIIVPIKNIFVLNPEIGRLVAN